MADILTTSGVMVNDLLTYWLSAKMIELAQKILVIDKISEKFPLESNRSKTLQIVRVQRLTLPNTPLSEGVSPDANALSLYYVNVTVEQWGIVVALTDVLELTTFHPMMSLATERVALAMKEVME